MDLFRAFTQLRVYLALLDYLQSAPEICVYTLKRYISHFVKYDKTPDMTLKCTYAVTQHYCKKLNSLKHLVRATVAESHN